MGELPWDRITPGDPPFTHTGIDHFGPLRVLRPNKKTPVLFYGTLFTCLVCRAVHLELTANLSADNFLLAFQRFVARRGMPKLVRSDNAQNFKAAKSQLAELASDEQEQEYAVQGADQDRVRREFHRQGIQSAGSLTPL